MATVSNIRKWRYPAERWMPLIDAASSRHGLDSLLVAAVVQQESAGPYVQSDGSANPYAVRVERGFWRRYGAAMIRMAKRSRSRNDDRWMEYPDLAATSYGLMQVMYQVGLERGMDLKFPTELCDPEIGIEAGCRHLAWCLNQRQGRTEAALVRYNGSPTYPPKVLAHKRAIEAALRTEV